ncbi:hypothetical protein Smic_06990 [Streptomyces microflavus]|uniref:Uncharacterized protein n=1 Tax=Streptomyces microflavus TaxID=1919 RepID=A0A7J0CI21_STRMI|nr:hypothetical protein Smic_06990 [Streptomyces microflavus]
MQSDEGLLLQEQIDEPVQEPRLLGHVAGHIVEVLAGGGGHAQALQQLVPLCQCGCVRELRSGGAGNGGPSVGTATYAAVR